MKLSTLLPFLTILLRLFKTLFDSAIQNQPENWQRAIFNITRQGKFSIALDKENNDEN